MIESNLMSAMKTMERSIGRMGNRGEKIDDIERNAGKLMESSYEFVERFDPWHVRLVRNVLCCPRWWFRCPTTATEPDSIDRLPWMLEEDA